MSSKRTVAGDSTIVAEAQGQASAAANSSGSEKLNASAVRAATSAKKRVLNTSAVRRTLKANNTALARSLSLAKEEVKALRNRLIALKLENQDLKVQLATAHNNPLYDELVRERVKTCILDIMAEMEEKLVDARTHFRECSERFKNLNDGFGVLSSVFTRCTEPMDRLSALIAKRIDEAAEFADAASPTDDGAAATNRKTILAARRKTQANPKFAAETNQGIREDAMEAVPRRRTVMAVLDKMEEDSKDEEDVGNGLVEDQDSKALLRGEKTKAKSNRRKTAATGFAAETNQGIREDATEAVPRRRTVMVVLDKTEEDSNGEEDVGNGLVEDQDSKALLRGEKTKAKSNRRKTAATNASRAKVSTRVRIAEGSDDDVEATEGPTTKRTRKKALSKPAVLEFDEDLPGTSSTNGGIKKASTAQRIDSESRSSEATGQVENPRPRRRTAAVSYKEPRMNIKLRR